MNQKLYNLIKLAQGNRTQNEYALHSRVSSSTLSLILKGQRGFSSKLLEKLASRAHNGVTYEDLMKAAGYLPEASEKMQIKESISPKMQEAMNLLKQIDEKNISFAIGMLKQTLEMQEMQKRKEN